jgi:hypothetical protein
MFLKGIQVLFFNISFAKLRLTKTTASKQRVRKSGFMKIGMVSCGFSGSSGVFAIALEGKANELICVDLNADLAKAHAEDILHATPFSETVKIAAGDDPELKEAAAELNF